MLRLVLILVQMLQLVLKLMLQFAQMLVLLQLVLICSFC
jgi:hypothetical protein